MSGGGGNSAPAQPSTTTQIQDIPEWEQGYVKDLLGQAQTIAAQPYQQFTGPQVAGFTDPQQQAFANIEGAGATNQANQAAAMGQAGMGANSANNIFGAGAGDINAATGYNPLASVAPYLGAATGYNSAAAAQPWLNQAAGYQGMAANAATPQGIQNYMSPYMNDVVQGLQNEANQNWNQNIMPGINDKFVGSGQYASGRNAQVLGQAAGNFQTGLSANVANALQQGYNTAGSQAANQAQLLSGLGGQSLTGANTASNAQGAQVGNLLNQANAAGTATQQQAGNLLNAGSQLGNLASTQATQQLNAGTDLGNLGNQAAATNLTQNQALQGVGQQQQQLNQTNLNTAMQNWQNQVNYPAQQTEYLNQIIRGLPAPTASTSSTQSTPAYSVSPLSAIGGTGASALSLLNSATGKKKGGIIKGYASGGSVDDAYDDEDMTPLDYADDSQGSVAQPVNLTNADGSDVDAYNQYIANGGDPSGHNAQPNPINSVQQTPVAAKQSPLAALDNQDAKHDNVNPDAPPSGMLTQSQMQQNQLLALARGMLTPSLGGSTAAALGQGLRNMQEIQMEQQKQQLAQNNLNYQRNLENKKIGIEQQRADMEKPLTAAKTKYYESGAGAGNRLVSVIDPETQKPILISAAQASARGLSPTSGYRANNVTYSPEAITMFAKAVASGAPIGSLGLGYGNNANKDAVVAEAAKLNPDIDLAGAQVDLIGRKAGARTVGNTTGKIEFASESLASMIPLAKKASEDLDRTEYPTINAIQNSVEKGTGDTKIIALNTYLNAVIGDQAALFTRGGLSTDAARAKAEGMANAALSKGQLNTYFDSVENEIKAQRSAGKGAMNIFTHAGDNTVTTTDQEPAPTTKSAKNWIIKNGKLVQAE